MANSDLAPQIIEKRVLTKERSMTQIQPKLISLPDDVAIRGGSLKRRQPTRITPYHYFYELYKQKLHYHSAIKVGYGGMKGRKLGGRKQYLMLS